MPRHDRLRRRRLLRAAALLAVALSWLMVRGASAATVNLTPAPLHVAGNHLVNSTGHVVRLRGVNRSSPETNCLATGKTSFFSGPTGRTSVDAMRAWGANAVRVPVNEDCWLGRNGLPASLTAADYRAQTIAYVRTAERGGLYVVLDLHFVEENGRPSTGQGAMADKAFGPVVWRSLAATFAADRAVVFDLYNEPHVTWPCWRSGCTYPSTGASYAGMQSLVKAVRAAGARQPLILTGNHWGNDIASWGTYAPADPLHQLVAGVHVYAESGCQSLCLNATVLPVALAHPVVIGEFGDDSTGQMYNSLPQWADAHGLGFLGFTWNVGTAGQPVGYHLIADWNGTPTVIGALLRSRLLRH